MEGANADSDHSLTWEDFFGSTTDLAPSLICIYDSLLEPSESSKRETTQIQTAKDARNDPPLTDIQEISTTYEVNRVLNIKHEINKTIEVKEEMKSKEPTMPAGSVKLPIASINKSALYSIRTISDKISVSDEKYDLHSDSTIAKDKRTFRDTKTDLTIGALSPNVQRMISSAGETTTLKFAKKTVNTGRATRFKSNIPLVGATSKISQSGVEIISSVDIYDQPVRKVNEETNTPLKPDFKIDDSEATYDVPTNNRPAIYDVPAANKTAFESLSLPYIDQSIELSISSNDREFDTKLPSKETSPQKSPPKVPPRKHAEAKTGCTNSLNRKEFNPKQLGKSGPYPEAVGSTGNLKTCTAPEKEISRLNPHSEVTRPLSMSSIASSSSTSSSGVQNKGVNSAYLASIESLDDNSDADVTSANGSNNFVNSTGTLNSNNFDRNSKENSQHITEEISGLSQLERVCSEIVQTENVYVEDLRQVVEGYLHVWRTQNTFSDEELTDLFNNIEDIYAFNRSLCDSLNSCKLDATCIARCFVDNTSGFSVYTSYCTGYPRTMERLAALASNAESARQFRERQLGLGHLLPLASYLLKPVQRILKYHLLLQNLVKQCASSETQYALLKMTGIAHHIDDMKRRHEHAVRVQEIQSLLYGWNGPDLTTYGELCAEGTFRVFGAKAMRHVFLFDKMLLVTKNREDGILAYKSHIMCNNMMLVEWIAGAGLSFHVIPWDAPRSQLTLQARSLRHKREWTLLLKRVILENYNAVIPSHARQLVMELGQNKTDDDMIAEKSHGLMTQASMRKQLSAPEYLEKRKLDRERRKSFENGLRGGIKKHRKYQTNNRREQDCDCSQVSSEKGIDYTCDNCYIDLCSDCETELNKVKADDKCSCTHDDKDATEKCPDCDKSLLYIDSGSPERVQKPSCNCPELKYSQVKEFGSKLNKRVYHSSDNIVDYDNTEQASKIMKTCLKCEKIKENIVTTDVTVTRMSRCNVKDKLSSESVRSKSKDDPQRSKLSKIGTWRRKSEPGLQQNVVGVITKKSQDSDSERNEKGNEKIEFECRNCGSNKITRKRENMITSDTELRQKPNLEIKMYNTKNIPKKISKIKKSRAKKGLHANSDTTAKFYADLSTDMSTENILHISESNDSLNVDKPVHIPIPETITKDADIDEETYKKLIEKTDSFKKNELEKVKYLNKQKVINEGSEVEDKVDGDTKTELTKPTEETEQPLEEIISQLLMQNREFQKLVKKQQLRNSAQRRHQRFLKSHSNPEHVIASKLDKLKPQYGRQSSETVTNTHENVTETPNTPLNIDEDHIYETLKVDNTLNAETKPVPHSLKQKALTNAKDLDPESDYVYLSFDQLKKEEDDSIYDVPVKSPQKVELPTSSEYYVTMENPANRNNDNIYDSLVEVCRRKKDSVSASDYLPMSPESPNTPEIWLSRQKEHFNMSRDRKSGSLPRSFQVTNSEDDNLSTFKCKPNSNSKTYVNREGKVKSTDRPFTIASDQSEISYDDVENYMNEGEMMKFNKNTKIETEYLQNISQSTLELEEEIDRCYKNNFEGISSLDKNKNDISLDNSQINLNTSITSSCEILSTENNEEKPSENIEIVHPEHRIYKPTGNVLSLKNVLSRFKNRTPNKNEDVEVNDQTITNVKTDKSPNEKRSALNPRSYSKNLLQRFRCIIGDEYSDSNDNKTGATIKKDSFETQIEIPNELKVYDNTSTSTVSNVNDVMSKSVCETISNESPTEKDSMLSQSCDNIAQKESVRPTFEKSVSMVSSTLSAGSSPLKSNNSSNHTLNKLPIYMQGSKHLGARIAQSDYADPTTLVNEKSPLKNINVLRNKNSIRPDSLFSNSSFVTTSSEGIYLEKTRIENKDKSETTEISDESFYEKSFEQIEHVTDENVFRDSAVYSDQEDEETKLKAKVNNDNLPRDNFRQRSFRSNVVTSTTAITNTRLTITAKPLAETSKVEDKAKQKVAPPVPAKPKLSQIPSTSKQNIVKNISKSIEESTNSNKTVTRHIIRSESTPGDAKEVESNTKPNSQITDETFTMKYQGIQIKRLSFERASLDSATRKMKMNETKNTEGPKTTAKTVFERRMELESMAKMKTVKPSQLKKPSPIDKHKSITTKITTYTQESQHKEEKKEHKVLTSTSSEKANTLSNRSGLNVETHEDHKGSWVKQVVNKFQ